MISSGSRFLHSSPPYKEKLFFFVKNKYPIKSETKKSEKGRREEWKQSGGGGNKKKKARKFLFGRPQLKNQKPF